MKNIKKKLELYTSHLPQKAYSCNDFTIDNKVRNIKYAIERKYLQHNDFNSIQWIVLDIDHAICPEQLRNDYLAPEPNLFVSNTKNGHAHLFYLLETAVHKNKNSSQKALEYVAAIEKALALLLNADMGYAGLLSKNATHNDWSVLSVFEQPYDLQELAEYVDLSATKIITEYGFGRNCILFDTLKKWAYKAIRQGYPSPVRWYKAVEQRAMMINNQFDQPLPVNEVIHTSRSIAKWTHKRFDATGFSEWQSNNGKRSGIARAKLNNDKRIQARLLRQKGLTIKSIADVLKVHRNTVANWLK